MPGENCSASCRTRDHLSFGACLRAKNLKIEGCRSAVGGPDRTKQKKWDAELGEYAAARRQGIQPRTTRLPDIRAAVQASNEKGAAYDAGTGTFGSGV